MSEALENLISHDADYSESKFKSKVENTFVQIKLAMVTGKIEKIDHFVNDETYEKIQNKVNDDKEKNRIQLYDELNVSNVQILAIDELEDCFNITVKVHSKALEYYIDRTSKKYISGDKNVRTERDTIMVYTKMKDAKSFKPARKCPTCGAIVDVNADGQCKYCHTIFNLEKYDWVITKMDI